MSIELKRIAGSVAALCLVVGIVLGASGPAAISIQAPATVTAGGQLCFEVTCFGGQPSVMVEVNEVKIPTTTAETHDPSVSVICGKVPGGALGSSVVITAVSATGGIATAVVIVR